MVHLSPSGMPVPAFALIKQSLPILITRLPPPESVPAVLARGVDEGAHWAIFADGGKWSLEALPENPGLAEKAGETLAGS